jgi:hypothetical protein
MNDKPVAEPARSLWVEAALLVAVAAAAGSLLVTLLESKIACPLCFYQRGFAFGLVAVLLLGLLARVGAGRLALLGLPLAIGGLGVAGFHVSLELRGILECPVGLFSVLTVPKQSLILFGLITVLLLVGVGRGIKSGYVGLGQAVLAVVLGGGLTWASLCANPKLADPPTKPYTEPPSVCRRPYQAP